MAKYQTGSVVIMNYSKAGQWDTISSNKASDGQDSPNSTCDAAGQHTHRSDSDTAAGQGVDCVVIDAAAGQSANCSIIDTAAVQLANCSVINIVVLSTSSCAALCPHNSQGVTALLLNLHLSPVSGVSSHLTHRLQPCEHLRVTPFLLSLPLAWTSESLCSSAHVPWFQARLSRSASPLTSFILGRSRSSPPL
eukprot:2989855-Rhodomonas_salina.2